MENERKRLQVAEFIAYIATVILFLIFMGVLILLVYSGMIEGRCRDAGYDRGGIVSMEGLFGDIGPACWDVDLVPLPSLPEKE